MVRNCNYIRTSLIQKGPQNKEISMTVGKDTAAAAAAAAKSLHSCPTLCDPIDGSLPGSPVPGILQARTLEWVAISFSNAWRWKWRRSVVSDSSWPHGLQPTRLLHPWDLPGKSTGVGFHCLLRVKATRWYELLNFCSVEASTSQACLKHMQRSYPSGRAHIGVHEKTIEHGSFFIDQLHISPFKKLKGKEEMMHGNKEQRMT